MVNFWVGRQNDLILVCVYVLYRNQNCWKDCNKFDTEVILEGGKVLRIFLTWYPQPPGMGCIKGVWGVSGASAMCFGENFIKPKLQNFLWFGTFHLNICTKYYSTQESVMICNYLITYLPTERFMLN